MLINLPSMPKKIVKHPISAGKKERPVYKYAYDEAHHCPRRVQSGEIDILEFTQQSKDDVDFKSIGKMLVDTRDNVVDHFKTSDGDVVDVTGLPRNVHEFQALYNKTKDTYEALPDDMKKLFNNDFDTFRQSYKSGNVQAMIDGYFKNANKSAPAAEAPAGTNDTNVGGTEE